MMKFFLIFPLLMFLSCSQSYYLKKEGNSLLEKGLYEEAEAKLSLAEKSDPNDSETKKALFEARFALINQKLVQIHQLRESHQTDPALKEIISLIRREKKWNIPLDYNMQSYQGKELEALWPFQKTRIEEAKKTAKVLLASWRLKEAKETFSGATPDYLHSMEQSLLPLGVKRCSELSLKTKEYYMSSFVTQFCTFYKTSPSFSLKFSKAHDLYSLPQIVDQIFVRGEDRSLLLRDHLIAAFQDSPWYDPKGELKTTLYLQGELGVIRRESYSTKSHPYVRTERSLVREHGVEVEKNRDIQEIFNYMVLVKTLEIQANVHFRMKLVQSDFVKSWVDSFYASASSHENNLPEIGLRPYREVLPDSKEWVEESFKKFSSDFAKDLKDLYKRYYCQWPTDRSFESVANQVLRCAAIGEERDTAFVDQWFHENFEITYNDAVDLLGTF